MTFAEVRKTVVAVLGVIVGTVPQVLALGAGIIPQSWAAVATAIVGFCTAVLVYAVPNGPKDPVVKIRYAASALAPVFDLWRARRGAVGTDVLERIPNVVDPEPAPVSPVGESRQPAVVDTPAPSPAVSPSVRDPFVVKPRR